MLSPLPIPDSVRAWLHARCLTDDILDAFKVGYMEKGGHGWVAIPVRGDPALSARDPLFYRLRAAPGNPSPGKMLFEPSGVETELFGRRLWAEGRTWKRVYVCEGEMDCMLLNCAGLPAVTSTSGATTWKEEWCALFTPESEVVLCFDADSAGEKGATKVGEMLAELRPDLRLFRVQWPSSVAKGYDVTDYFTERRADGMDARATAACLQELVEPVAFLTDASAAASAKERKGAGEADGDAPKAPGPKEEVENAPARKTRLITLDPPAAPVSFSEWKGEVSKRFPKLADASEVCASVIAQLLINDVANPFTLILTDKPGSGKTLTLNFFRKMKELMYFTSDFTPAAFVSSMAGKSEEQLRAVDLLPKIRWRTLIVKDLAPLLSDNDDTLRKHLGMLTDILDGEGYRKESGAHGSRGYSGDYLFMFLAASTPFPPRVWKLMTGMGHRLFFLSLESKRKGRGELMDQIRQTHYTRKVEECRAVTHEFLRTVWAGAPSGIDWDSEGDDPEALTAICAMADFLALFRGDIYVHEEKWSDGRVLTHTEPRTEDASRINQCLYNLARGHAVICGRRNVTMEDLHVVVRVVVDTAPAPRPKIFRELLRRKGEMTAEDVAECLGMTEKTAKKEMFKFTALGICEAEWLRHEAMNEVGEFAGWEGQARRAMRLKKEFEFWYELLPATETAI